MANTHYQLTLRDRELYTGDCPPERPCRPEDVARHRQWIDSLEQKEPGLVKRLVNFTRAVVQHVITGAVEASAELKARRLAICEGCDLLEKSNRTCKHSACGCFVDVKAGWQDQHCPLGKW